MSHNAFLKVNFFGVSKKKKFCDAVMINNWNFVHASFYIGYMRAQKVRLSFHFDQETLPGNFFSTGTSL